MWLIDYLILPLETRELAKLNKIWEAFNEKKLNPKETRYLLYHFSWKKQRDKVEILIMLTIEIENLSP